MPRKVYALVQVEQSEDYTYPVDTMGVLAVFTDRERAEGALVATAAAWVEAERRYNLLPFPVCHYEDRKFVGYEIQGILHRGIYGYEAGDLWRELGGKYLEEHFKAILAERNLKYPTATDVVEVEIDPE